MKLLKYPMGFKPGRAEESYCERDNRKVLIANPSPNT